MRIMMLKEERKEMVKMKERKNISGFTLGELLIVVAIIGVLVSISIPVFARHKLKAHIATDQANVRSAKAAAMAEYYTTFEDGTYAYDAEKGMIIKCDGEKEIDIKGYGSTPYKNISEEIRKEIGAAGNPISSDQNKNYVVVDIKDGVLTASWSGSKEGGEPEKPTPEKSKPGTMAYFKENYVLTVTHGKLCPPLQEGQIVYCEPCEKFLFVKFPKQYLKEANFDHRGTETALYKKTNILTDKTDKRHGNIYFDGEDYYCN